jgi:hypothetical protein
MEGEVAPAAAGGAGGDGDEVAADGRGLGLRKGPAGQRAGCAEEGHHRDQAGGRHEIRVVERRAGLRQAMQQLHLQDALSNRVLEASTTPIIPGQRAPFTLTRLKTPLFDRWI